MLRAKKVTFLRTESGVSALCSSWTYAGQKGDISRHRARSTFCPTLVHLEYVGRTGRMPRDKFSQLGPSGLSVLCYLIFSMLGA